MKNQASETVAFKYRFFGFDEHCFDEHCFDEHCFDEHRCDFETPYCW